MSKASGRTLGVALATALAIGIAGTASAGFVSGDLDTSFGVAGYTGGKVVAHARNDINSDLANGLVLLPGGKLVAAGESTPEGSNNADFALAGFEPYGGADTDFGKAGFRLTSFHGGDDVATAIARAPHNKLVVAGFAETSATSSSYDFAVARYTSRGKLDRSFSHDGRATTRLKPGDDDDQAFGVVVNSKGKITLAGQREPGTGGRQFALVRYRPGGKLDKTFSHDGKVLTNFPGFDFSGAMAIAKSGKKVVAAGSALNGGSDFAVARYTGSGKLDGSFDGDGRMTDDFSAGDDAWLSVLVQGDGKIVTGGTGTLTGDPHFIVERYLSNGDRDPAWNGGGIAGTSLNSGSLEEQVRDVTRQQNGKIVAAGDSNNGTATDDDFLVARYETDGDLDPTFHAGFTLTDFDGQFDRANALVLQGTKPVLAGEADTQTGDHERIGLARYFGNG